MAATSWDPLQPKVVDAGGNIAPIFKFKEAAGQTFKAGAVVELVAGLVTLCDDEAARLLGIVQADASGTTSNPINVQVFRPGDFIEMSCIDADATDVDTLASGFSAGQTYGISMDANSVCKADLTVTNALTEELVFVAPVLDATGASTYRGIFCLEGVACQLQGGTA